MSATFSLKALVSQMNEQKKVSRQAAPRTAEPWDRRIAHIQPGSRVVSVPDTPWADLMDYERSATIMSRGVPEHVARAVAGLWSRSIPTVLKNQPTRWKQLLLDAESLIAETLNDSLLASLLETAWTLADVFGVNLNNPNKFHSAGLCWQMRGSAVVEILPDNVTLDDGRSIAKPTDVKGREFIWRLWS